MSTTTESAKKSTKKVNGNKSTEVIIGTAATKLTAGIASLGLAVESINSLAEKANQNVLIILEQEDKLGQLEQELSNKKAQNKYEIELAYKTDVKAFVAEYLKENELMTVNETEWLAMEKKLEDAEKNTADQVAKAVNAATNSLKSEHTSTLKVAQLEHEKKEASNAAEITQLKMQNKFLEEQVNHWKTMLEKQMNAETERAKHQPNIHVNGTNTGR